MNKFSFMIKALSHRFISIIVIINLTFFSLYAPIQNATAEETPNPADLKTAIESQANNQTTTVNADTSSAPTADFKPEIKVDVTNTGDNVSSNTESNNDNSTDVNNQSNAGVTQNIDAVANTGENTANGNICVGDGCAAGIILTGDAAIGVLGVVNANNTKTTITMGKGGIGADVNALNTGNGLTLSTGVNSTNITAVNNGSTTTINQATNALATTGSNTASGNIAIGGVAGAIITGRADATVNYLVAANGAVTLIGGDSNGNGPGSGATIVLANTGDNARFNTRNDERHFIVITNKNRASISQTCGVLIPENQTLFGASGCRAITGYNTSSGNIAKNGGNAGVIETSDATVNVVMVADVNNTTNNINSDQGGGANAATYAVNTGDNVDVTNNSSTTANTEINNSSDAKVSQNVYAIADTGHNTANGNICLGAGCRAGFIRTGKATVNVALVANVNNTNNDLNLGSGDDDRQISSLSIFNSGDNTRFSNDSTTSTSVEVNNSSISEVLQFIAAAAITGFNSALGNIGNSAGMIFTGAAAVNVGLDTKTNTDCTAISLSGLVPANPCLTPTVQPAAATQNNPPAVGGVSDPGSPTKQSAAGQTIATISSFSKSNGTGGSVLGAATGALPATGPETALWITALSLIGLWYGVRLKSYKLSSST